jgi:voltage-gated potassium channel
VDKSKIRNHFIICGWKEDMQDLLRHILLLNKKLKAHEIVVVANRTPEDISDLKSDAKLADVTVIIGDYFQQSTLTRAAPESARKVLILADSSVGPDGRKPSATEADARTIMTAIALSNIAKQTVVAAEIIDPTLDHYLKMAGVGEIIYSREYSRLLLGSASSGTGLVNVFHDLVDPRSGAFITTQPIPELFHEKPYGTFRSEFQGLHKDMLVIGILENTGNPHTIKESAFREAQKTPSIGRLIENLKTVKSLRCNNPIFHPRDDFKIGKGAAAIVLVNAHAAENQDAGGTGVKKATVAA